ncbi:MAG: hypothetical protein ACREFR_10810 [Limisphaerales bacterium]
MLNSNQLKVLTVFSALALAMTVKAQTTVIGSFQGAGDGNNGAYWQDASHGYTAFSSDSPYATFATNVVPGYAYSLELNPEGASGYTPQVQVVLTPAEVTNFNNDGYLTFTFSVPTSTNGVQMSGGYYQLVNVYCEKGAGGGYGGYENLISGSGFNGITQFEPTTAGDTTSTNSNQGGQANYYFYSGAEPLFSEVVTINYSSFMANADLAGDTTNGLVLGLQFNQAEGSPMYLNNVELSPGPFGAASAFNANVFTVDDYSTNGVGPENPVNDDYYNSTNIYLDGQITNVYGQWYGNEFGAVSFNTNNSGLLAPGYPSHGCLQFNINWATTNADNQFLLWEQGPGNDGYEPTGVSSLVYTDMEMDVRWDPSSVSFNGAQTYANYGPLRFGINNNYSAVWLYTTNIPVADTNWIHIVVPLSASNPNENPITGFLIGADNSSYANNQFSGEGILYIDNVQFKGPLVVATTPAPIVSIQPAKPGLRIFAGSSVNTYDRATISTINENESWIGGSYPVSYSFSLLSYPNNNINQTMVEILPITPLDNAGNAYLGGAYPAGGNEYADYQDPNGMWLVLAPNGGGAVTATVEWKTNAPAANPNQMALTITNSTAIGTWTWTFTGPNNGTITPPGGVPQSFTVTDATVTADFGNPCGAVFGLQPNSTAGESLWEDWGMTAISGTTGLNVTDDWTQQTSDFSLNSGNSPDNNFSAQGSANPPEIIIARNGLDAYWFSWPTPAPAAGFGVVATTNILAPPNTWVDPSFYANDADFTPPRADSSVLLGPAYWTLMPYDDLPTVDGNSQPNPPTISDPLSPNAFWIGTTNYNSQYP